MDIVLIYQGIKPHKRIIFELGIISEEKKKILLLEAFSLSNVIL